MMNKVMDKNYFKKLNKIKKYKYYKLKNKNKYNIILL